MMKDKLLDEIMYQVVLDMVLDVIPKWVMFNKATGAMMAYDHPELGPTVVAFLCKEDIEAFLKEAHITVPEGFVPTLQSEAQALSNAKDKSLN